MTFYSDLSEYTYHRSKSHRSRTKNVGWLEPGHQFERVKPARDTLDRLWDFGKVSIAQMRGIHQCEFCHDESNFTERYGETLLLGDSEIRVFSPDGNIFAAPTLIYHYVNVHDYKPPDEFIKALF